MHLISFPYVFKKVIGMEFTLLNSGIMCLSSTK